MAARASAGGKAEATGGDYETRVAAWYCGRILLGGAAQPLFDLPADVRFVTAYYQTGEPIDDVNIKTSDAGRLFVQAKRTVYLSNAANSPLVKALDQFVRQYKSCAENSSAADWARPLKRSMDRLILTTRRQSGAKITETLPRLLRGLRDRADAKTLSELQTSMAEKEVAETVEAVLRQRWTAAYGVAPSESELAGLLRLTWIQVLDVEDDQTDAIALLDLFRSVALAAPAQAGLAFAELVKLCGRLRADRSGTDLTTIQRVLGSTGVSLLALPDYRADIASLRKWTQARLKRAPRYTRLLENDATTVVRRNVHDELVAAAVSGSLLLVGDPGAGKSGLAYGLAEELAAARRDVVLIPVDLFNVTRISDVANELELQHPLPEVLANWPGDAEALLVVDALDAARKLETQTVLREVITEVLAIPSSRWRVVASVRKYDLRYGTEWSRIFRGWPPLASHVDPEFPWVAHVAVERLSDTEIQQTATSIPDLAALFSQSSPQLKLLLRNIFNLHLLADLLSIGAVRTDLAAIRSQPELLSTYWNHRVRQEDGKHDEREQVLRAIVNDMIGDKSLQASRTRVLPLIRAEALVDLERNDILRQEDVGPGRMNDDALLFTHHVLFDYAVARLVFRRGRDADAVAKLLCEERALSVMLSPSLTLSLADAWAAGGDRADFWTLAFKLASEPGLPAVARLAAPAVAAEAAVAIADLAPLLGGLQGTIADSAINFGQYLVGALFVRLRQGFPLVGPEAGPWMEFAAALSEESSDARMFTLRPLLATVTEMAADMTTTQRSAAGVAARRMLKFGWSRDPRSRILIINGLNAVAETFESDPAASGAELRRALVPEHVAAHGYEELPWISRHIGPILKHDPELVVQIYEQTFGYAETSQDRTGLGNSNILSLSSHKRQDYEGAWFALSETLPGILRADFATGVRATSKALKGYIMREQSSGGKDLHPSVTFPSRDGDLCFRDDWSHLWYRGGYRPVQDAPVLVTKFDAFLKELATQDDAAEAFNAIMRLIGSDDGWAVLWSSLFVSASAYPDQFGRCLAEVARAHVVMTSDDSRPAVGQYLSAAYHVLTSEERRAIEAAILELSGRREERIKQILVGCLPIASIETSEMREFRSELDSAGGAAPNVQPAVFSGSVTRFDTDAYLEAEGVKTDAGPNAPLREALRKVEDLPAENTGNSITIEVMLARIPVLQNLVAAVDEGGRAGADVTLLEHAAGVLAEKTVPLTLANASVLSSPGIRPPLQEILGFAARSTNPHFRAEVEEQFRSDVSWGGPSARTGAATGLMFLGRFDEDCEPELSALVHSLSRDPVGHVRFQIVERINFRFRSESEWVWSELTHVIEADPSESVVAGALAALSHMAEADRGRANNLAKRVLSRFEAPGVEDRGRCREYATTFLFDTYIWTENQEAQEFASTLMTDIRHRSGYIRLFLARYSGELIAGNIEDVQDVKHRVRVKVLKFYEDALEQALGTMRRLAAENDLNAFSSWPEASRVEYQEMVSVVEEIALRLHLSVSGVHDGSNPLSPPQIRLFDETLPLLEKLSGAGFSQITHHLVQMLESFVAVEPPKVFELIAKAVRTSERYDYGTESMAVDLVVRIVERYLADHRGVFADPERLGDLIDCLDVFVRAGWPSAQALTFRLGEIWR